MLGKSCTDAIFGFRRLQEKYCEKKRKLYHIFLDSEKAFDRVPRKAIEWALRRQRIPEPLIRLVICLYTNSKTKVSVADGTSELFDIKVGVHQGSTLSPLLFVLVIEEVSKMVRRVGVWEMLYAGGGADVCLVEGGNGTKRPEGEHGENKAIGQWSWRHRASTDEQVSLWRVWEGCWCELHIMQALRKVV